MGVQKKKLTRQERRAQPMANVVPHEPLITEDEPRTLTATTSHKKVNHAEHKERNKTIKKGKALSNKQKMKIQRGVEISDKLYNKTHKKNERKENRLAAKKIYE
ncbi:hypothetical protein PCANC_12628 [Puccinia coronata f. sp. avenae]|uniref:Uncharacterized protein n=1 Tax=Puccinia coronata f. sp. avenae TaxID=200324 RepID=A0A2N5T2S1_9BASI|nr:hypothetical protein PCANC_12628 [Puccinia coronata f. sp. avenae]PLW33437.1 hypothetical protein PCASD_17337 [Puccinia coronata f. sp. avenae]